MKESNLTKHVILATLLAVSLISGSMANAQIVSHDSIVAFGPLPSLPLPYPSAPSLDPKGSGTSG